MTLSANVTIDVLDHRQLPGQRVIRTRRRHNLVTLSGRNLVRDLLLGGGDPLDEFAVGIDGAEAASSDTALGNEKYRDLLTQTSAGSGLLTVKFYLPSTAANGMTLREAGIFANDVLFARVTHPDEVKNSSTGIVYSWQISIGAS